MNMLEVKNLSVAYGGILAIKGIDVTIASGELVSLIGANGAGKSTLLKAICGMQPITQGSVYYQGNDLIGMPTYDIVKQRIALVPEGRGVFSRLSVAENLDMGAYARHDRAVIKQDINEIYALFPRLYERRTQNAGTLSGGEQQMLVIGRAMMSRPQLLLLDEPSMGLAPIMVQKIFETIQSIANQGVTIFLVEQNAKLALEISHRGYVMESGLVTLQGESHDLLRNPQVQHAYLGE